MCVSKLLKGDLYVCVQASEERAVCVCVCVCVCVFAPARACFNNQFFKNIKLLQ